MPDKMFPRVLMAGAALALGFAVALPATSTPVAAQEWLWGGGSTWGGEGRQTVRFGMQHRPGQVIVSFGDRRLYYVTRPGEALSYPIAIPRDQSRWQGVMNVSMKRVDPPWTPTPTMLRENPKLPRFVPGGHPLNPMGARALYLGSSAYRIHGTDAPWTIGQAVSKGCIRMYNKDVIDLYPRVNVGARVTVTWQRYTNTAVAAAPAAPSSGRSTASDWSSGSFSFPWFGAEEAPPRQFERRNYRTQKRKPVRRTVAQKRPAGQNVAAQ